MTLSLKISRLLALFGSVLAVVQIFLLLIGDKGICFNDGCEVVDSMTTVSPIFFSIGGFVFFQLIFWGMKYVQQEGWYLSLLRLVLLGALAAEAVLFSFQYFVAEVFCSYCLIIFGLVFLLNLLAGWKQILTGVALFAAVVIGFSVLQFNVSQGSLVDNLDKGTYARLPGDESEQRYLFFSSSCSHCEEIIELLRENKYAVSFNPTQPVTEFPLDNVVLSDDYDVNVNMNVLRRLGITQVPLLLIHNGSELKIISGSNSIAEYLDCSCEEDQGEKEIKEKQSAVEEGQDPLSVTGSSQVNPAQDFLQPEDDSCSAVGECE